MQAKTELQTVLESLQTEFSGTVSAFDGVGVFGESCVCFTSKSDAAHVFAALVRAVGLGTASVDTVEEAVRSHRTFHVSSNLGYRTCVYFVGFEYVAD